MGYNSISVDVSASTIGSEMANDADFAYAVFEELAYYTQVDMSNEQREKFLNNLFNCIFEQENEEVLNLFENIVQSFSHLKEKND